MRVSTLFVEQSRWLLPPHNHVGVKLELDELELFLVRKYRLHTFVIVSRKPTVIYDDSCTRRERDNNLYVEHFLTRETWLPVADPAAGHALNDELQAGFAKFEQHLE